MTRFENANHPDPNAGDAPTMEFHVSRAARDRLGLETPWFSLSGNVVLADLAATRRLAQRMNQRRGAERNPERAVPAGELHAMGLIDEILHFVAALYREQRKRDAMTGALAAVERALGKARLDALLVTFGEQFPPLAVYRGDIGLTEYLEGRSAGVSHREMMLEELTLLWLANVNPAFAPFLELFDDEPLEPSGYDDAIRAVAEYFAAQPTFGPDEQSLVDMLRSPALASPDSLSGQLDYIRRRWGHLLGDLLQRLLTALDVIREEERAAFMRFAVRSQIQRSPVSDFRGLESEVERFSPDRDWMPRVVMIAKSASVWLDQLSRRHGGSITHLDQVPDAELDQLARWGISALWLIGVWERSPASRRIKQLCGNPDAGASAYSLLDYSIAGELGGVEAYERLRDRAQARGIRLASDMVPNHMGIDSRWMMEHPDWFLSLPESPYPAYSFHGADLSPDPAISIQIEDHYYDRTDAAVVFKRHDRRSGETRYVYHGNDGTLTPWNDTAQLDYLNPRVREGLIQTILHVARHFPIIRFDAAMTLAKRHYQRLWFPEPGTGGAIPSRAEHGLTREQFDAAMPVEFWREVVDRVQAEMPDTLLLAEAFWLMEGYFVRTLGMHRVYNSAFMNMLRDEENANYRAVIKNTLEFDPEILKRYVNFMNNPDERTAVDQFGKDDKYFGVCTLMVTLPGLPMFGHGQIEGLTERYGMEFRRASRDESPDRGLVERHEREIFPLLHRRHLFAGARDFLLYDFYSDDGRVCEDVFAYSNRSGDERALVLYHNRYATVAGWIRTAAAVRSGENKSLRQSTLGEGLGLSRDPDRHCVFRDHLSGLEYVRSSRELCERGLYARLDAYRCHVFLDFREVTSDQDHPWATLARELEGRGVPNANEALLEITLRPVVTPFAALANATLVRRLMEARAAERERNAAPARDESSAAPETRAAAARPGDSGRARGVPASGSRVRESAKTSVTAHVNHAHLPATESLLDEIEWKFGELVSAARARSGARCDEAAAVRRLRLATSAILRGVGASKGESDARGFCILFGWAIVSAVAPAGVARPDFDALRDWRWDRVLIECLRDLGVEPWEAARGVGTIDVLTRRVASFRAAALGQASLPRMLEGWLGDGGVERLLGIHQHEGVWWLHQESWDELVGWMAQAAAIEDASDPSLAIEKLGVRAESQRALAARMIRAASDAGYRLDRLIARVAVG